jgi:hypothetical protein
MATVTDSNAFMLAGALEPAAADADQPHVHVYGQLKDGKRSIVCVTEDKAEPKNLDLHRNEIVVGLGNIIPLWVEHATLRYRFQPRSFQAFANPGAAKDRIRTLINKALDLWGDSCPVAFVESAQGWDFEVVVRNSPDCDAAGCVLASAFFPDGGRHKLTIYPTMFEQDEDEQIETLVHEIGHVFGLRHFFAKVSETQLPAEIFGTHVDFTIMNYGSKSVLTDADRSDVKTLYRLARSGELRAINGTPIKLVRPFSAIGV